MPLTNTAVRNALPAPKANRLYDSGGLYLEVTPAGGKLWRLKYRYGGKEKRLALGAYPSVSLKEARSRRDDAKRLLSEGIDPAGEKRARKLRQAQLTASSFNTVALEWEARHLSKRAESHRAKVMARLERDVFPYLGRRPVAEITAPEIIQVLRRIERRNALETAHRVRQHIGQVIRYAIANGLATIDPTQALRHSLPKASVQHMAAPEEPAKVGEILRAVEGFSGSPVVAAALRLLPLVFVRPGELRTMRWEQVDFESKEWRYRTTKTGTDHLVPLAPQALEILEDLRPLTGHLPGGWVFPGGRSPLRPMSNAAINAAYRRLGIDTREEITGHGWRACARTLLHEQLGYRPEVIEHQLAHAVPDAMGRAYNRTRFIDKRREMMVRWADYLDQLRTGAEIIPLSKHKAKG